MSVNAQYNLAKPDSLLVKIMAYQRRKIVCDRSWYRGD
jgi:hypothetical protein